MRLLPIGFLLALGSVASACPIVFTPQLNTVIDAQEATIVIQGAGFEGVEWMGPVLTSGESTGQVYVLGPRPGSVVLRAAQPLQVGTRYTFAFSRNGRGVAYAAPQPLFRGSYWIAVARAPRHLPVVLGLVLFGL